MVGKISRNICKVCKREFKLKDSLNHHLEKHHGYEAVSHKCYDCFKRFRWLANLEKHVQEVHMDSVRHECGICASTFKYGHHLKQHMRLKHNPHAKPSKCPDCGEQYERRDVFLRHMKLKHPRVASVSFKCKSCTMVFMSQAKRRHHHLKMHTNYERSKCPHCPSSFKWRGHLSGHIKKKHMTNIDVDESVINKKLEKSRERTNRCRHCGLIFKMKFDLLVHYRRSHNENISIYRCCQCVAVFVIKSSLESHIVQYHKENNIGKHRCEQCFPDINVKPIAVKVERGDDKDDEGNCLVGNNSNNYLARDIQNNDRNFEQTISDHPDLRDMILMKSQLSNASLNSDNTLLNVNGQSSKVQKIVEFEVPLLNSETNDESKIANANRDASTQVNFYEDMFCNKSDLARTSNIFLDGDLWKSLSNIENPLRIVALSDISTNAQAQIAHKNKIRKTKANCQKSRVGYRCEECNICFNEAYSLENHIQIKHSKNISSKKGDENTDVNLKDTILDKEHSAEKEDSINIGNVVDKVLQIHLHKVDMNSLKNKGLDINSSKPSSSTAGHYDCKQCSASFKYKRHYFRHSYQKHGLNKTQHNCSKCDLMFDTKMQFNKHIRGFHLHKDNLVTKPCAASLKKAKAREKVSAQDNKDKQSHLNKESKKKVKKVVFKLFSKSVICVIANINC